MSHIPDPDDDVRILVVEDDPKAARFVKQGLQEEGHVVDVADDGNEGARLAHINTYDLFILDIQVPGISGLELARELRRSAFETPILMLTARDSTQDVVRGLDAGADDYLTKPFAFDELLARVRALTRRQVAGPAGVLRYRDLEMDRLARSVKLAGRSIDLSPREFRLLEYFLLNAEQVVTRTRLLEKVWDMTFDPETNVVEAHISNLRRKLEERSTPRLIQTVRGSGYALRSRS